MVESDAKRKIVVVSALGKRDASDTKITDLLYILHAHLKYGVPYEEIWNMVVTRFLDIKAELHLQYDIMADLEGLKLELNKGIAEDYLVSRGEYLTAKLMSDYLGYTFVDAKDLICFNYDGKIDYALTEKKVKLAFSEYGIIVVPGFYGAYPNGSVKLLSRGGSDVTGSILAKCLNVSLYENWTDVSGIMVADPRIIHNPVGIEMITYAELRELSYMGFNVLHEDAIFPVRTVGIPINIKNTNAPDDEGTWIVGNTCQKSKYVITGIAGKKGFASINIEKDMMNAEVGFGRKVLKVFEEYGVSFEHMPSGIDTLSVMVHQSEFVNKEQNILSGINKAVSPDHIDIQSDLALIAVVGRGMKAQRGTAGRIFSALAHANVNVRMIDQGSSELNIIIGVANEDFDVAIKAIYDIFVETRL